MRQPNWSGYASESAADFAAEDRIGAYTVELPTPDEDQALSLELARENAEGAEGEEPRPACDWCELAPGDEEFAPYCSASCALDAAQETYASIHPRPEEVG